MKKFNKSLILPIIYASLSIFVFIFNLTNDYLGDWVYIFSPIMFVASMAAIILIVIFNLDLKKNFLIYIISVLVSAAGIFISLFTGDYILVSILLLIAQSIIYWLRKASKSEIIVWLLLNPVYHFLISLLLLVRIIMY